MEPEMSSMEPSLSLETTIETPMPTDNGRMGGMRRGNNVARKLRNLKQNLQQKLKSKKAALIQRLQQKRNMRNRPTMASTTVMETTAQISTENSDLE